MENRMSRKKISCEYLPGVALLGKKFALELFQIKFISNTPYDEKCLVVNGKSQANI